MIRQQHHWFLFALTAGLFWGIWGVVSKFISSDVTPYVTHALFTLGMILTLPFVVGKIKWSDFTGKGIFWGIIAGVFAVAGNVAVYLAFTANGQASVVIPLTNLYPLVTIIIAVLLMKEKLAWINVLGLLFAIPAILLLSGQTEIWSKPLSFFSSIGLTSWFILSVLALVSWGVFSACQKITTNFLSAEGSYLVFVGTSAMITLLFFATGKIEMTMSTSILALGTLAGTLNGLGVLASFAAYRAEGKASTVTTIAGALQPMVTILLAILLLKEKFSWIEGSGMLLAISGALLLSYEKKTGGKSVEVITKSESL